MAKVQDKEEFSAIIFRQILARKNILKSRPRLDLSDTARTGKPDPVFVKDLVTKWPRFIFAVLYGTSRVGQGVKTPPFHGGITGSNPVRGTKKASLTERLSLF